MAAPVTITFLGGLGEIGRNCAAIELDNRILLIDCGIMFPDADMLGIDLVLPDFHYLRENVHKIEGVIATHGHEDHVGGLSFLLRETPLTIFGSELTLGLARNRIVESGLVNRATFVPVTDGERRKIGPFDVEFIPVTHSVPHGFATAFHTPQGIIVHSGDFKIDLTPVDGRLTDLARFGALSDGEGIRLLLADSTNSDEAGHSRSESSVGQVLYDLFHAHEGRRVICACFASHVHRVQQVADSAIAFKRKVAFVGRSMHNNVTLARNLGHLKIPDTSIIDIEDSHEYPPGDVCVICTGSQGEPLSALSRMAGNDNRFVKISDTDTVILSSHPIPGNEFPVNKVIDGLIRLGAEVVHSDLADVHATGHAKKEELKTFHAICQPEYFIPVHGEYRHLVSHSRIAIEMGCDPDNVVVAEDGDQLVLDGKGLRKVGHVPAGYLYVDGTVGDISHGVLRDRRVLAEEGVLVVIVTIDVDVPELVGSPEVITRGWIHAEESEDLINECASEVEKAVLTALEDHVLDIESIQRKVRKAAGKLVNERTKRRPMIVPVVMEV